MVKKKQFFPKSTGCNSIFLTICAGEIKVAAGLYRQSSSFIFSEVSLSIDYKHTMTFQN